MDKSGPHSQQKDHEPVSGTEEIPACLLNPPTKRGMCEKRFCFSVYMIKMNLESMLDAY